MEFINSLPNVGYKIFFIVGVLWDIARLVMFVLAILPMISVVLNHFSTYILWFFSYLCALFSVLPRLFYSFAMFKLGFSAETHKKLIIWRCITHLFMGAVIVLSILDPYQSFMTWVIYTAADVVVTAGLLITGKDATGMGTDSLMQKP